jgi:hypothetical protein
MNGQIKKKKRERVENPKWSLAARLNLFGTKVQQRIRELNKVTALHLSSSIFLNFERKKKQMLRTNKLSNDLVHRRQL